MTETVIGRALVEIIPDLKKFGQQTNQQVKSAMAGTKSTFEAPFKKGNETIRKDFNQTTEHINKKTGSLARSVKSLLGPAITAFSILGAIGIAKGAVESFTNTAIEVIKLQRVAGGTAEEMSRLRFAAVQSGVAIPTFTNGVKLLSKNLVATQGNAKKTADITKLLGFNFQDAHGKVKNMSAILPDIAERFKTMPNGPQKTALALKLFGRSGTEMLPFLNKGRVGIQQLEAASDKFGTTLSGKNIAQLTAYRKQQREFAATMLGVKLVIGGALLVGLTKIGTLVNTFIQQMRSGSGVGGAFVGILRMMGGIVKTILMPPIQSIAGWFGKFIDQMRSGAGLGGQFADAMKSSGAAVSSAMEFLRKHTGVVKALGIAIGAVVLVTKAHTLAMAVEAAGGFTTWLVTSLKNLRLVAAATKVWTAFQWLLNLAMDANPIGIVVVAIAALAAGIIIAYKHSETFRKIVNGAFAGAKVAVFAVRDAFATAFHAIGSAIDAVKGAFDTVKTKVSGTFDTVQAKISDVVGWFKAMPGRIASSIGNTATTLFNKGVDFLTGLKNGIMSVAKGIGDWMLRAPVVKVVTPWLYAGVWLIYHGKQLIEGFKNGIVAVANSIGAFIGKWVITPVTSVFSKAATWLLGPGKNFIVGLKNGIWNVAKGVVRWVYSNIIQPNIQVWSKAGIWLYTRGRDFIIGLKNGIWNVARSITSWINANVIQPGIRIFNAAGTWLYSRGAALIGGLKSGIWAVARTIGSWINSNVIQPPLRTFASAGNWLKTAGNRLIGGLKDGIAGTMRNIGNWVKSTVVDPVIRAVKTFFGIKSPSTVFAGIGKYLIAGLFKGMGSKLGGAVAKKVFGDMPSALSHLIGKGLVGLAGLPKKAIDALGSVAGALVGGPFSGGGGPAPTNLSAMQALVRTIAAQRGWGAGAEWNALYQLVQHESGFNPNAQNPTSTAYGLFQFLNSTWGSVGATKTSDPWGQTAAGLRYIAGSYGSPINAWAKWQSRSPHWYAKGTPWVPDDQLAYVHRGEGIIPADVNRQFRRSGQGGGTTIIKNNFIFPNYVGDKNDLVKAIDELKRKKRI